MAQNSASKHDQEKATRHTKPQGRPSTTADTNADMELTEQHLGRVNGGAKANKKV